MRLPRWTVWPALALLAAFVVPALPGSLVASERTAHPRVVVLGIDGMDPEILADVVARFPERMPHFRALIAESGGIRPLRTSTPPQSPVAWSTFLTGMDPGGHGVFDFIHRDPMTRAPLPSTTRETAGDPIELVSGWQLPVGGDAESNRSGRAFWSLLADHGVPSDVWRVPANFPVEPARGWSFSGMFTPAVDSAYGEYKLYTSSPEVQLSTDDKVIPVRDYEGVIDTYVPGPGQPFRRDDGIVRAPLRIHLDREHGAAAIETASRTVVLRPGQWSDFVRLTFPLLPAGLADVRGIVRFHLRELEPDFEMYCSPVNIDPLDPVTPVSAPADASADVARAVGLYYTQGMPEDVKALQNGALDDAEFMDQSSLVHDEGVRMLDLALDRYLANEDGGLLFFYFSGIDLCGHMMWRHGDREHPFHDAAIAAQDSSRWSGRPGSTWADVIHDLYLQMDPVLGRVRERLGPDARLIVMSDHGFAPYRRKFHLNTWLVQEGYLVLRPGRAPEKPRDDPDHRPEYIYLRPGVECAVDWSRTRAYGIGFNALYLNLAGRELDDPSTAADESGIVPPGPEADTLLFELRTQLEDLRDPKNGERVVLRCDSARRVYGGARLAEAPDLVIGFNRGYGNSDQSTLGRIPNAVLDDNDRPGTFNGSHLMAPEVVPGILLTNGRVLGGEHGLADLTVEILKQYGVAPPAQMHGGPVLE